MIAVRVFMKATNEPLKRTPVVLQTDADGATTPQALTDRSGVARFDLAPASGKVLVSGIERYHGRLDGEIAIALWSVTQSGDGANAGGFELPSGSNAYPGMTTRRLVVDGRTVLTDGEGYLVDPAEWSEAFARAQAAEEGLLLGAEHWEVIRFLRESFARHGTQATVRDMIRHFRNVWGEEKGSNRHLHTLFPRGGPQKQGNRLAGLLRTKGEH
jgi:tRNA 2-thiouridine synthesizing protein E